MQDQERNPKPASEKTKMPHSELDPTFQQQFPEMRYLKTGCAGILLFVIVAAGAAWGWHRLKTKRIESAARAILENIRDGDTRTLYDESDQRFKRRSTYEETVTALEVIRTREGELLEWRANDTGFDSDNESNTVAEVTYIGKHEKEDTAITLWLVAQDGTGLEYRLFGFEVDRDGIR